MRKLLPLVFLLAAPLPGAALHAQSQAADEQGQARKEMRKGNVRSLRDIERQVVPTKPGMKYLGPEYDPTARAYRLKFIRDGRVVFVDVDARSGNILNESR